MIKQKSRSINSIAYMWCHTLAPHQTIPVHGLRAFLPFRCPLAFLGAFATLRKASTSLVLSACPSVSPSVHMEELGSHWRIFMKFESLHSSRHSTVIPIRTTPHFGRLKHWCVYYTSLNSTAFSRISTLNFIGEHHQAWKLQCTCWVLPSLFWPNLCFVTFIKLLWL
jgi:hypothetical protein